MQMRTLDYLGLADTPQPPRATLAANPFIANMIDLNKQANRFRSYSVNAVKEKYPEEEDDEYDSGSMTPHDYQVRLQYELAQTQDSWSPRVASLQASSQLLSWPVTSRE
jgi:protein JSN1